MPNDDEADVIIGNTSTCLGFPVQIYLLQVGGTAKGFGRYTDPFTAILAAERSRKNRPTIFIRITGEKDGKIYYQLPGERL